MILMCMITLVHCMACLLGRVTALEMLDRGEPEDLCTPPLWWAVVVPNPLKRRMRCVLPCLWRGCVPYSAGPMVLGLGSSAEQGRPLLQGRPCNASCECYTS